MVVSTVNITYALAYTKFPGCRTAV